MKFAKELQDTAVPEWRPKYLDYKKGKKKIKAISKAIDAVHAANPPTPNTAPSRSRGNSIFTTSPFRPRPKGASLRANGAVDTSRKGSAATGAETRSQPGQSQRSTPLQPSKKPVGPVAIAARNAPEPSDGLAGYGSFEATPPMRQSSFILTPPARESTLLPENSVRTAAGRDSFELPLPALTPTPTIYATTRGREPSVDVEPAPSLQRHVSMGGQEVIPSRLQKTRSGVLPSRTTQRSDTVRPFVKRILSFGTPLTKPESLRLEQSSRVVDQLRSLQAGFHSWLDEELEKVEAFYKAREDEATARKEILRVQLREFRDRRAAEVRALMLAAEATRNGDDGDLSAVDESNIAINWIAAVKMKAFGPRPGSNSKALMSGHPEHNDHETDRESAHATRDYVRRQNEVPYRLAKKKLKMALQELYRGMLMLDDYAKMNHKAFKKINKKYDKAVGARPLLRYMSEKVNKAHFVQSDILENSKRDVEDLYARYLERGNRKIASSKLKSSAVKQEDQTPSAFLNGLLIGIGVVFATQGVIYGSADLHGHPDPVVRFQTGYLLQIYGGYFLALYLFTWFCIDCCIWDHYRINYKFVFEFDPRHNLDWRELAQFPSFLIFLLGLFMWLNFTRYGSPAMYIYYPVILIFLTICVIFLPAPVLFYRSRRWFVYSHWRLLLAGLYPVEFRDFFLGDMYCSLTYFTSNIELFFCLYATYWHNPTTCNSTHSRLLGFFSALPGIWRALQCVRRYWDTRNVFPHLVNCGKYTMTIMTYVSLSLYRIDQSRSMLALFSTFATLNTIYVCIWDLFMDWSLLQPGASNRYLRNVRGFKNPYIYYAAMVFDPIARCNWIFYCIYTHDLQHSTIASFLVGLSEVTRRGVWTLFRVENEHCSNVAHYRAMRDIPLPYEIEIIAEEVGPLGDQLTSHISRGATNIEAQQATTGAELEAQESRDSVLRRRGSLKRTFTKAVAEAHRQDFEKKRKPGVGDGDSIANRKRESNSSEDEGTSDEDEDDERAFIADAEALTRSIQENRSKAAE